ncbi:MAG: YifB family Mg chelatase-like AAA ATPase [Eubacteriales bacterium]|nr:YifB family Mg chelatase-like AAA ATPase [Eubacteriales bacterium]
MYCAAYTGTVGGLEAYLVQVEVDISPGLPSFTIVGYPASQVMEAKERVRTAMRGLAVGFPSGRVTVNLSPGTLRKQGTGFDLPVLAAMLGALGSVKQEKLKEYLMIGEVHLDGAVTGVQGILPILQAGLARGLTKAIIPQDNAAEAACLPGIAYIPICHVRELLLGLQQEEERIYKAETEYTRKPLPFPQRYAAIYGQVQAKRAAATAVAGCHPMLMVGSPGSGKTMLAESMQELLPSLNREEMLEVLAIQSISGRVEERLISEGRPSFFNPHYHITVQGLIGGGVNPVPGVLSLAHRGILFLDELTEYRREVLEALRVPLEAKQVVISRLRKQFCFPAQTLVVAAMNPCQCGHYPDFERCTCTATEINRYLHKLSWPLLERMDICVDMRPVKQEELWQSFQSAEEKRQRQQIIKVVKGIELAKQIQMERYRGTAYGSNAALDSPGVRRFCSCTGAAERLLEKLFVRWQLSVRQYNSLLRVARTVADMQGRQQIEEDDIKEAAYDRSITKGYWGKNM